MSVSRVGDVHKNLELALRAVAMLAPSGIVERYLVIGSGPGLADLQRSARAQHVDGILDLLGPLEDAAVSAVLAGAHVGLFPSRRVGNYFEGFGMIVHELAGAGLPVLVGASGGAPEACAGEWAVLLDPNDLGTWVAEIGRLGRDEDRRHRLATDAHAWASQIDSSDTVRRYVEAIQDG